MDRLSSAALVLCVSCAAATGSSRPAVPSAVAVSPDDHLAHTFFARGVQIYECRASAAAGPGAAAGAAAWVFDAPEADLFATPGETTVIGHHFAGPTWQLDDGSRVTGHVHAKAKSPDGKGVDWLLLDAAGASGPSFAGVTTIRRVDTVGGKAPEAAAPCTPGERRRVDYTATYEMFVRR